MKIKYRYRYLVARKADHYLNSKDAGAGSLWVQSNPNMPQPETNIVAGFFVGKEMDKYTPIIVLELKAEMAFHDYATDYQEYKEVKSFVALEVDEDTYEQNYEKGVAYTFNSDKVIETINQAKQLSLI